MQEIYYILHTRLHNLHNIFLTIAGTHPLLGPIYPGACLLHPITPAPTLLLTLGPTSLICSLQNSPTPFVAQPLPIIPLTHITVETQISLTHHHHLQPADTIELTGHCCQFNIIFMQSTTHSSPPDSQFYPISKLSNFKISSFIQALHIHCWAALYLCWLCSLPKIHPLINTTLSAKYQIYICRPVPLLISSYHDLLSCPNYSHLFEHFTKEFTFFSLSLHISSTIYSTSFPTPNYIHTNITLAPLFYTRPQPLLNTHYQSQHIISTRPPSLCPLNAHLFNYQHTPVPSKIKYSQTPPLLTS